MSKCCYPDQVNTTGVDEYENRGKAKFTNDQIDFICYCIGEWYLMWKDKLVDYDDKTHRLGYAKEQLKLMICGDDRD